MIGHVQRLIQFRTLIKGDWINVSQKVIHHALQYSKEKVQKLNEFPVYYM